MWSTKAKLLYKVLVYVSNTALAGNKLAVLDCEIFFVILFSNALHNLYLGRGHLFFVYVYVTEFLFNSIYYNASSHENSLAYKLQIC